jgi:hypothetical protein
MIGAAVVIGAVVGNQVDRLALGAGLGAAAGIGAGASWKAGEAKRTVRETAETDLEALNAYVDGKMKRYTLLFAVNGGAFAVGQFLLNDDGTQLKAILPLRYLAEGAIVYTAIMTVDIWLFGQMMRERFVGDAAFTAAGKALLILIGILLMGGWLLIDLRAPR